MPRKRVYVRVTISLREEDVKQIDRVAEEKGLPRSALIRMLLLEALQRPKPQD
jgi:metal-responsive CopG/Arc/MetJ family transcriptional regulator